MEQQAVELLMKKSGTLAQDGHHNEQAQDAFAHQFTQPLTAQVIEEFRDMFGITEPNHGALAAVTALAQEVEAT